MDNEKQKDEITALESIYNQEEFSYSEVNGQYECTLKIFISLPTSYYVAYKNSLTGYRLQKVPVSHLPPLVLSVVLSPDYPSKSPPKFTLRSSWLCYSSLAKLCKELDQLWEANQGQEILFTWMNFLKEETLTFLNIQECVNMNLVYRTFRIKLESARQNSDPDKKPEEPEIHQNSSENKIVVRKRLKNGNKKTNFEKRAILDLSVDKDPIQTLVDYNEMRIQIEFRKNFYTCKICFDDKLGEHCTQFVPCNHTFCKDCIIGYFESRIKEGSVQSILCPEENCTSEAPPSHIKELLSNELFSKYDSILLSATLDTMTDIIYCPRRQCQYPVSREPNEQMASCPVCNFTFCVFCKMVYHGIEPCKVLTAEKQNLLKEYEEAKGDKKLKLEQRYGKKQLQALFENTMSENWITMNSHKCPHCKASIEKSDGCNKMTCGKCNTYFCWLCGARLDRKFPYLHYQNPNSNCYNLLHQGIIDDDDDEEAIEDDYEPDAEFWLEQAFLQLNQHLNL